MTAAQDLAATDLLSAVRSRLLASTEVRGALTGDPVGNASLHITARNEPPYPHVRLTDPVGGVVGRRILSQSVQIEVLGDPDGSGGKAVLGEILRTIVGVLIVANEAAYVPGEPVVTDVAFAPMGWSPEPGGQPRYLTTATVTGHAPN